MLQTSANLTRRINASSGFYYAVLPSFAGWPFILVRCPYLLSVWANACVHVCLAVFACVIVCAKVLILCLCKMLKVYPIGGSITCPVVGFPGPCLACLINLLMWHLCCRLRYEADAVDGPGPTAEEY